MPNGGPFRAQEVKRKNIIYIVQTTLLELEAMCCRASANTNKTATKRYGQEVVYDDAFHALLAERRRMGSKSQRAQISKSIRKHLRRALREQRNGRIKHVLDEFKVLDRLTHHVRAPVYPCPTMKDEKCPGADDTCRFRSVSLCSLNFIQAI